ncbi:helicase-related protein [soil metagenome]
MSRLEEIEAGTRVKGISSAGPVRITGVRRHGEHSMTVFYEEDGTPKSQVILRDQEDSLQLETGGSSWTFDGDGTLLRLVSEALRIRLAYLFDPYLAVHTSRIDPLPHQITAVYGEMLPRQPLRFLLADDPGAGKTIMTGLLLKELMMRGDLERCLIVSPGNLVEQWQDELSQKFGLSPKILTRDLVESSRDSNPFEEHPFLIARLDMLSRDEDLQKRLEGSPEYDLVVVDEAHKMSATSTGGEVKYTKRYNLGERLAGRARHYLLLTATPHSGKQEDFELFMALLDEDRFEGRTRDGAPAAEAGDMMRRLLKEEIVKFDGKYLFPERHSYTINYDLTPDEQQLYDDVTSYVREEMNRAERFGAEGDDKRRVNVGFALQILQRRLASSPEAIHRSLERRRKRLESRLAEENAAQSSQTRILDPLPALPASGFPATGDPYEDQEELDEAPEAEVEEIEERVVDRATAANTVAELRTEIATLSRLEEQSRAVRYSSREDAKWRQLSAILDDPRMTDGSGRRRKLIIFTEAKDTLFYLAEKIRTLRGRHEEVVTIHGGLRRQERQRVVEAFTHDPEVTFLVANDAAGEGINLQSAHLMVNYDLPWNPNRLEQRFGRIHRIGQTEVCHLWNLVASNTREGDVYTRLLKKLEVEREALEGRVFDVLGKLFEERPLRELLLEAIRYGEDPEVRARLERSVDSAVDREHIQSLLEERALVNETMTPSRIEEVRERMERAEARRLQPHFVRSFFLEAFNKLCGSARKRESGRYEVKFVPAMVRDKALARSAPLPRSYDRICFDKADLEGLPAGSFVCPGHPLLEATIDELLDRHRDVLKEGAVLVDEEDVGEEPRALVYLEHAVQDGRTLRDGRQQVISRRLQFVEMDASGTSGAARDSGPAPYLDYRPLAERELELLKGWQGAEETTGLPEDVERIAEDYAMSSLVPEHLREIQERRLPEIEKVQNEVEARLKTQINHWDRRAEEFKARERAGQKTRLSSAYAQGRADDLSERLERRRKLLEEERRISPLPAVVRGAALIVPGGLLARLKRESDADEDQIEPGAGTEVDQESREEVERLAMDAVMQAETDLGRDPRDVSGQRGIGYDIESKDHASGSLVFIEVKGRREGADTVTLTRNEVLCSRNEPEKFRLALVVVRDGVAEPPRYVKGHNFGEPKFPQTASVFNMADMLDISGEPV